ncbi:TetR/AcrR family transcriptional regulator [Leptothoe sp. PORK10 BA2]|uniref:TetR/AcrR family transcriptional regulator n=1 Tax=Leptothoe sp. PORK10 BA2 TaxID=3110254 RepID=UPI002B21A9D9|nr:TetR/AcrR family transcriptional regulator [Leptothoe sp. PORK10 BA2]MEA5463901.1 TetR/AcrR family transcriptional regulator [Leptothoe sp. PORK10 BA2]
MARPRKITTEQILKAAQAIFLEKGFGASTKEIASEAGIAEGSIFKRFPTKEELFIAAMGMSQVSSFVSFVETMSGQDSLPENLEKIGLEMIRLLQELLPKMMMLKSKGLPVPAMMLKHGAAPPVRILTTLTHFFEKEISLERMCHRDPQIVAMIFTGSLIEYVFLTQLSAPLPDAEDYVKSMVEVFWISIQPSSVSPEPLK